MVVYLTRPASLTAHLTPYCHFLTRRPTDCGVPHELEARAAPSRGRDWVEVCRLRNQTLIWHAARLCAHCGHPIGWQTATAGLPEQPIYGRRRRAPRDD